MRALWLSLLVLAATLAGCADDSTPEAVDDGFQDVQVDVDDETGAIRGVVVNDAIVPVADATVSIVGTETSTLTDEQGRFVFNKLEAGTYFLTASKELHEDIQFSVDVTPGVEEPPIIKVQLNRLFQADPYMQTIASSGFFTCSQGNTPPYLYSSSSCHSPAPGVDLCDSAGACLDQERTFHADVAAGWQSQVFEMVWQTSASGTSENMGIVVSTYKPERNGDHWFMDLAGPSPLYGRMDVGETHPSAQEGSGPSATVPADGMEDMSYFMSVRPPAGATCALWCFPPGVALDQKFDVWLTQFYYAPAPDGWSVVNGDPNPF